MVYRPTLRRSRLQRQRVLLTPMVPGVHLLVGTGRPCLEVGVPPGARLVEGPEWPGPCVVEGVLGPRVRPLKVEPGTGIQGQYWGLKLRPRMGH